MKKIKTFIFFIIFSINFINPANSMENKILFKVNNEIISSLDISNEINYLGTINKEFKNTTKEQAFEIAKKSLVREKTKEIELKKFFEKIKLEDQFLNNIIVDYFKDLEINSISDFESYFDSIEINPDLIKKKISIEVLWNQLIFSKYNHTIKINKQEIIKNLKKNNKQKQFLLSEILFNINENEKLEEKFNLIKNEIINSNFSEAALKYSISDSANKGGKLGWVNESAISKKINNIIQDIDIGNYSEPIIIPGGFLILKIVSVREVENDYDLDKQIEKVIKEKTNEQLNQFSNIFYNKIQKNIVINEL